MSRTRSWRRAHREATSGLELFFYRRMMMICIGARESRYTFRFETSRPISNNHFSTTAYLVAALLGNIDERPSSPLSLDVGHGAGNAKAESPSMSVNEEAGGE